MVGSCRHPRQQAIPGSNFSSSGQGIRRKLRSSVRDIMGHSFAMPPRHRHWRRRRMAQRALQIPTAIQTFAIVPQVCARAQAMRGDRKGLLAPQTQTATRTFAIAPPVSACAEAKKDRTARPVPSTPTATRTFTTWLPVYVRGGPQEAILREQLVSQIRTAARAFAIAPPAFARDVDGRPACKAAHGCSKPAARVRNIYITCALLASSRRELGMGKSFTKHTQQHVGAPFAQAHL